MFNLASKYHALDLIERHGIVGVIVQTGGASGFVASHLLRGFQLAAGSVAGSHIGA